MQASGKRIPKQPSLIEIEGHGRLVKRDLTWSVCTYKGFFRRPDSFPGILDKPTICPALSTVANANRRLAESRVRAKTSL